MAMPSHRLSISACWFAAPGICWVSTDIPFKASSKLIFSRTKAWGMAVVNNAFTPASVPVLSVCVVTARDSLQWCWNCAIIFSRAY